ncbi:hypothetical protein KK120_18735 [Virgibacillus dakarensis]|nr:hypothetical protein [Virgibacillus dakarensis]
MKFFSFNTKLYELLGWQKELSPTEMQMIKILWDLEQTYHYNSKRKTNWDLQAFWFHLSDTDFMDMTGVRSRSTLSKYINNLINKGVVKVSEDRSTNQKGKATRYLIVKPIPLPKKVQFPKLYIERYGLNYLENLLQELKELHLTQNSVQELDTENDSVQNLDAIPENSIRLASNSYTPKEDVDVDGKKEREKFSSDSQTEDLSQTKTLSERQEKIVSLSERYIANPRMILEPYFEKLSSEKEELILSVLELNATNGFEPENNYSFVLSLFTDDNELEKMAAASIKKSGGFTKPEFPTYEEKKVRQTKKNAGKATDRGYYDELFSSISAN